MNLLSSNLPWSLANPKWAQSINPILSLPIINGNIITGILLVANTPQAVNHLLQRTPQGWFLTDNSADSVVWRASPFNQLTLTLESSADTTISIWVF